MNRKLEVLLITPEETAVSQFRVIADHDRVNFHVYSDLKSARVALDANPDMAFIDATLLMRSGVVDVAQVSQSASMVVIAIGSNVDADTVRTLMKSGIQDVLSLPPPEADLLKELERVMEKRNQESLDNAGKLIAFTDVKGGSGGTTIAVNVAWGLSDSDAISVLLIDLDVQFGDVALAMDVQPTSGVLEALAQSRRLDKTLLSSLTVTMENGLQVLAAPPTPANLDMVKLDDLRRLLEVAVTSYDIVIVDVPRILTDWTRETWRWSDHVFLILQGCVSEIRDARLLMDEFSRLGIESGHIHLVHNRKGARGESASSSILEKSFETVSIHDIRNDYAVAIKAHDSGKPVVAMSPGSGLASDIMALVSVVAEFCNKSLPRRAGFLGRLLGNKSKH